MAKQLTPTERAERKRSFAQQEVFARNHMRYYKRIQADYVSLRAEAQQKVDDAQAKLEKLDVEYGNAATVILAMEQSLKRIAQRRKNQVHEPQLMKLMKLKAQMKALENQMAK